MATYPPRRIPKHQMTEYTVYDHDKLLKRFWINYEAASYSRDWFGRYERDGYRIEIRYPVHKTDSEGQINRQAIVLFKQKPQGLISTFLEVGKRPHYYILINGGWWTLIDGFTAYNPAADLYATWGRWERGWIVVDREPAI